uniref:Uncharacterized protein n=1 Tax=Ceratitis capitata TaxID=7213 RepID=W8CBT9_CERCA
MLESELQFSKPFPLHHCTTTTATIREVPFLPAERKSTSSYSIAQKFRLAQKCNKSLTDRNWKKDKETLLKQLEEATGTAKNLSCELRSIMLCCASNICWDHLNRYFIEAT